MKNFNNGLFFLSFFVVGIGFLIYANSTGKTGSTLKNGNGCDCHGPSASTGVNVTITGPSVMEVGKTEDFKVTITGGPLARGGTNIASSAGVLDPIEGLKKLGDELTHISPRSPQNNSVTFEFSLTAPTNPGTVTLFAVGNSVNNDGNSSGDQWNFAPNKVISVEPATNINDFNPVLSYQLKQNYPNPFNPTTGINFQMPNSGFVSLKVYDIIGNEISTLVNEYKESGTHTVEFDASGLTSGVYFYRLDSGTFSSIKKMILTR